MSVNVLSPEERKQLSTIPDAIHNSELVRFFTLSSVDRAAIDAFASSSHQLDQAAHICLLRWLGWSPVQIAQLPSIAVAALGEQLNIPNPILLPPAARTSRLHAQRAREHLGWQKLTSSLEASVTKWLKQVAAEHDRGNILMGALLRHLYQEKIVRPGLSRLERLVETTRAEVMVEIAQSIYSQLKPEQRKRLSDLLTIPKGQSVSHFQQLKETPKRASGNELLTAIERIESIRAIELEKLDLSDIHPKRVKLLAQRAKRRTNWFIASLKLPRRYLYLVCFLIQTLPTWIDMTVQMHGEIVQGIFRRAEAKRDTEITRRGQILNNKVLLLAKLARLVLDEERIPDGKLRPAIYDVVPRDRLAYTARECDEIAQPADYTPFTFAVRSYPYLRRFTPDYLRTIEFQADEGEHVLLEAVSFMKGVNQGKHAFQEPPLKFVPWRWKPYVKEQEGVNRHMYELCLHDTLAKAVDRGELWVSSSRSYSSLRNDWISDDLWPDTRQRFLDQFPEVANVESFLEQAKKALDAKMAEANQLWPDLQDEVQIKGSRVHLKRLDADEEPAGTARLREQLTQLFPRIGIAQLLLEVNHWVGVDQHLTSLDARERPTENLVAKKLAVLMAEGLNIGLQNMSDCVPTMSYTELAGVYDRHIREETLRHAIAAVVNFYHRLPITRLWGDGTASSSDGQLFGVPVKTIYSQYHPKSPSKSGRAVSLYTHISDHAIPFYGQVIHHLSQEGAHVLDGLLYHETELTPTRHFVDTGGYQDTLWGVCDLLGISLEPRLRDIGDMRLFRMRRRVDEYPHIRSLFSDPINTRVIREHWDDMLRLVASIHTGAVPASQILGKLNAYHVESGLYKALRETGRIAKTRFLLDYFTRSQLRRQVHRGLNRQESVHALVRTLFVGHRGELRLRDLSAQLNRASCLQLVTAMVVTWNAAYTAAARDTLAKAGSDDIADEQLAHILPVMSEQINLLGRYEFNPTAAAVQTEISALPLRSMNLIIEQLGLGI